MNSTDGLALIGRSPGDEENVYIATGDSGMGLTHGTIAVHGYKSYEQSAGASANINMGDGNPKHYAARVWMPIIVGQAEGGIRVRESPDGADH